MSIVRAEGGPRLEYGTVPDWLAAAEEPVFDCRVHVDLDAAATSTFRDGGRRLTLAEPMLPPGQTRRPLSLPGFDLPHASAGMAFTDTSNRRWQRGHNGGLSQLVDDPT
jgi:hypothetical protein